MISTLLRSAFRGQLEQACQRLTTLGRPTARGMPFFLVRVDRAGNVSKRLRRRAFPFSRFGGVCPRWSLHAAFGPPAAGRSDEIVETPEGARFFTVPRARVRRSDVGDGGRRSGDRASAAN